MTDSPVDVARLEALEAPLLDALSAALAAKEAAEAEVKRLAGEAAAPIESVRLCHGYEHRNGWNVPKDEYDVPIRYDPALPTRGEIEQEQGYSALHPTAIVLREWDERVLLHEVLHALLDSHIQRTTEDPHGHRVIAHVEVALRLAGWRFAPAAVARAERAEAQVRAVEAIPYRDPADATYDAQYFRREGYSDALDEMRDALAAAAPSEPQETTP